MNPLLLCARMEPGRLLRLSMIAGAHKLMKLSHLCYISKNSLHKKYTAMFVLLPNTTKIHGGTTVKKSSSVHQISVIY